VAAAAFGLCVLLLPWVLALCCRWRRRRHLLVSKMAAQPASGGVALAPAPLVVPQAVDRQVHPNRTECILSSDGSGAPLVVPQAVDRQVHPNRTECILLSDGSGAALAVPRAIDRKVHHRNKERMYNYESMAEYPVLHAK
jgi:hypothetical protein